MFACLVICFGMSATGFITNILSYLTQKPEYECTFNGDVSGDVCTANNICHGDPRIDSWQITEDSLNNWQSKLHMTCEPPWKTNALAITFFLGWSCTLLWLPRLSDTNGRWLIFTVAMAVDTVLYTVLIWTNNLNVMIILMFLFGLISSARLNVGFVYMMELMPRSKHTLVGTCWCIAEGCIYLAATIYFNKVSKDSLNFMMVGYVQ